MIQTHHEIAVHLTSACCVNIGLGLHVGLSLGSATCLQLRPHGLLASLTSLFNSDTWGLCILLQSVIVL